MGLEAEEAVEYSDESVCNGQGTRMSINALEVTWP